MECNREAAPYGLADASVGSLLSETMTTSSRRTNRTLRKKHESANEAMLLSKATSQAMIAARSIVLAGGSQQTALSTAKAAAQSILVPSMSDAENIAGSGKNFLGRRKAKRQAEIVASMALLSVNNSVQAQQGNVPNHPAQHWDASMLVQHPLSPGGSVINNDPAYTAFLLNQSNSWVDNSGYYDRRVQMRDNGHQNFNKPNMLDDSARSLRSERGRRKHTAVPRQLPDNKNITAHVPQAEPIYYSSSPYNQGRQVSEVQSSYSSEEDTQDDSTVGDCDTTIATSSVAPNNSMRDIQIERGASFMKDNVDPLLTSLTSAFQCGISSPACGGREKKTTKKSRSIMAEARGDAEQKQKKSRVPRKNKNTVEQIVEEGGSVSSADSAEIVRAVLKDDSAQVKRDEYSEWIKTNGKKSAVHSSMEQVVLRALSVRDDKSQGVRQMSESLVEERERDHMQPLINDDVTDAVLRSRFHRTDEVFTGTHSNTPEKTLIHVVGSGAEFEGTEAPSTSTPRRKTRLQTFIRMRKKNRESAFNE